MTTPAKVWNVSIYRLSRMWDGYGALRREAERLGYRVMCPVTVPASLFSRNYYSRARLVAMFRPFPISLSHHSFAFSLYTPAEDSSSRHRKAPENLDRRSDKCREAYVLWSRYVVVAITYNLAESGCQGNYYKDMYDYEYVYNYNQEAQDADQEQQDEELNEDGIRKIFQNCQNSYKAIGIYLEEEEVEELMDGK